MRVLALMISLALVSACNDSSNNLQRLPIGSPCATSGQCGTGRFFCETGHPNGYCKADCHKDSDCPSGSLCAGAGVISPGACHKSCPSGPSDCRTAEGYVCKATPTDASSPYCDAPAAAGDGGA